jgi:hypothetical protein
LVDLTNERGKRVRSLTGEERRQATHRLSALIRTHEPEVVVALLKRVGCLVEEAVACARVTGAPIKYEVLPFPMGKWIKCYKEILKRILRET